MFLLLYVQCAWVRMHADNIFLGLIYFLLNYDELKKMRFLQNCYPRRQRRKEKVWLKHMKPNFYAPRAVMAFKEN